MRSNDLSAGCRHRRKLCRVRAYDWNSGLFLFKASAFLAELERLEPELLAHCRDALAKGAKDLDFFRLDQASFTQAKAISIDYAVMERTDKAAVVPVEMGWSDIGSWEALWTAANRDASGNVTKGDVLLHGARNSYLRSAKAPCGCGSGVEDIVVVCTDAAGQPQKRLRRRQAIVEQLERGRAVNWASLTARFIALGVLCRHRPWRQLFQVKHIDEPWRQAVAADASKRAEH